MLSEHRGRAGLDRVIEHPEADLPGPVSPDRRGVPPGLAGLQGAEPAVKIGVESALDAAGVDPQLGGDVAVRPASVGRPHDLEGVTQFAVGDLEEGLFKESASAPVSWMWITMLPWRGWLVRLLLLRTGQHQQARG
jgi:hypothetical protein